MNRNMIRLLLSKLLLIEAVILVIPLLVSLFYQESIRDILAYLYTIAILLVVGGAGLFFKPLHHRIYAKEGVIIVAMCWILWSFFGSLPFVFSGRIPSLIDAFFEVSSGFTTTGATIIPDLAILNHSFIFWRSCTHLIGGMGVLVFALAIMDNKKNSNLEVMQAEVPGPVFGKVVSKLRDTAQILYIIYLFMFVVFAIILFVAGMPIFDSIVIAMGTAGTGGFTVYNDGIAHYNSQLITYLVSIGVTVFGINFNLYYFLLLRKLKAFFGDEELRTYLGIIAVATILITINVFHIYHSWEMSFRMAFFQVTNIITTTGFGYGDVSHWPLFSEYILLLLMAIGGSAGSTAGGLKVIRGLILYRISKNQILSNLYPNRVLSLHVNGSLVDTETQNKVLKYLTIYVAIIMGLIFIISLNTENLLTAFSAVFSCFNNIGPMLGTTDTFAIFSPGSKLLLSLAMIAGRLEIYPMLLIFLPRTWSKR
ncbi:Potassium uptake protein TrkH [Streptococcus sp. DD10]|uniref:TrkH family potassium uptake protein n=1 Tax=Streptococcus sp. DD10 TaxID=1777878 RepID=UPI0007944B86|nr:TrkH family potassium uptake protein [Streptococcus sp. DD10]KXT73545.1 Potassium uptake protein TrkH [Streptococcus sp. DD10]